MVSRCTSHLFRNLWWSVCLLTQERDYQFEFERGELHFLGKVCFTSGAPSDVLRPVPVKGISLICSATPTLGASLAQWSWDCIHHSAFPWGHLDGSLAPFAFQELFFLYHGKNLTKSQFKRMKFQRFENFKPVPKKILQDSPSDQCFVKSKGVHTDMASKNKRHTV